MSLLPNGPHKEVDVEFLVFIERYATDLLRWDIFTFFGQNPHFCGATVEIAQQLGRSVQAIRPELGDLALQGILEKTQLPDGQAKYRLTQTPHLRRLVLKLAESSLAKHAG